MLGIDFDPSQDYDDSSALSSKSDTYVKLVNHFSGNVALPGASYAAHCYAGHQFGAFSGQLGDGATMYIGEVSSKETAPPPPPPPSSSPLGSQRLELQFKGAGLTPYSRTADGRKVLRSSLREFLCSRFMFCSAVPTTLSPTIVGSDSKVVRDKYYDGNVSREEVAVITRVAKTFLRFGSFEIFRPTDSRTGRAGPSPGWTEGGKALFDFVVKEYYPHLLLHEVAGASSSSSSSSSVSSSPSSSPAVVKAFLKEVTSLTALLVSKWQLLGFTHGVLNTDNMSIIGVTIDYGPYGFMEYFDPSYTPNGSDPSSRYRYEAQPDICLWNCEKLAEALFYAGVLTDVEEGKAVVKAVWEAEYPRLYRDGLRKKLGLVHPEGTVPPSSDAVDDELFSELFKTLADTNADFTETFLALEAYKPSGSAASDDGVVDASPSPLVKTLDALAYACPPVEISVEMLHKSMKMSQPSMPPEQLHQLWQIAKTDPERLGRHFGAPAAAIVAELGAEMDKFGKYSELEDRLKEIEGQKDEDVADKHRASWRAFLSKYKARLDADDQKTVSSDARGLAMSSANPRFVLKNWMLQDAVQKAEAGDYAATRELLSACDLVYDPDFRTKLGGCTKSLVGAMQRESPEWACGLYNT